MARSSGKAPSVALEASSTTTNAVSGSASTAHARALAHASRRTAIRLLRHGFMLDLLQEVAARQVEPIAQLEAGTMQVKAFPIGVRIAAAERLVQLRISEEPGRHVVHAKSRARLDR